jgi:hypothetical protein
MLEHRSCQEAGEIGGHVVKLNHVWIVHMHVSVLRKVDTLFDIL